MDNYRYFTNRQVRIDDRYIVLAFWEISQKLLYSKKKEFSIFYTECVVGVENTREPYEKPVKIVRTLTEICSKSNAFLKIIILIFPSNELNVSQILPTESKPK